jgi:hypothetical protein
MEREFRRLRLRHSRQLWIPSLGRELAFIQSAVPPDGGCSVRVASEYGSLLLDTGLPGALSLQSTDDIVLLSHGHLDHCGGLITGMIRGLPIVMSTATAMLLIATGRVPAYVLKRQAFILDPGEELGPECQLQVGAGYKRIWLVTTSELKAVLPRSDVGVLAIGRTRITELPWNKGLQLDLDSAVWTLHSSQPVLYDTIHELSPCQIVLFHNFASRLKKFVRQNNLSCSVLDTDRLLLTATEH